MFKHDYWNFKYSIFYYQYINDFCLIIPASNILNHSCSRASEADILLFGSYVSISDIKSLALWETLFHLSGVNWNSPLDTFLQIAFVLFSTKWQSTAEKNKHNDTNWPNITFLIVASLQNFWSCIIWSTYNLNHFFWLLKLLSRSKVNNFYWFKISFSIK